MGTLFLVRHGQASFGAEDYDRLSKLGEQQAYLVGSFFRTAGILPGRVVVGRMRRHLQTAEHFLEAFEEKPAVETDPGLDEFDHVELVAKVHPDAPDGAGLARLLAGEADPRTTFRDLFGRAVARWTGGEHDDYRESFEAFRTRAAEALHRIVEAGGENVFVFTSGGPISVMTAALFGLPPERILSINKTLVNGGVTRVRFGSGPPALMSLNERSPLEAKGWADLVTYW